MAMKKREVCAILMLLGLLCVVTPARSDYLPVQIEKQQTTKWCWAAASVALLNRYLMYPGIDVATNPDGYSGQCLLATKLFERDNINIDCCDPAYTAYCEDGSYDPETTAILNDPPYNMNMSIEGDLPERDIETLINDRKAPFIVILRDARSAHAIVAVGLSSDKRRLKVMNPWDGLYTEETIADWKNGNTADGRPWERTLSWAQPGVAPTPPDNVRLRHTAITNPDEYSYIAPGTITTESFDIHSGAEIKLLSSSGDPIVMKRGTKIKKGAKFCASPSNDCSF